MVSFEQETLIGWERGRRRGRVDWWHGAAEG